jgi:hypothetical protein
MKRSFEEKRAEIIASGLNPNTLKSATSGWETPTGNDVRLLLRMIGDPNRPGGAFSGTQASKYLGLKDGRTIRVWQNTQESSDQPSKIPYTAWVCLVYRAELGVILDDK